MMELLDAFKTIQTFRLMNDDTAIKCLICGLVSHHPEDVKQRYCASCHQFHEFLWYQNFLEGVQRLNAGDLSDPYLARRTLDDGRMAFVLPLTFNRARISLARADDPTGYYDGW